jgi:hypothetical protein
MSAFPNEISKGRFPIEAIDRLDNVVSLVRCFQSVAIYDAEAQQDLANSLMILEAELKEIRSLIGR